MGLVIAIIVGGIVGWLAAQLAGRDYGVFASIIVGIIGSFIGSFISMMFTGSDQSYLAFSWPGAFWSFVGALTFVLLMNAIQHRGRTTHS